MNPPTSVVGPQSTTSLSLFQNVTVLLPIVISIVVLIAVLATLFAFMRKQSVNQSLSNLDARNSIPKSELSTEIFPLNDFVRSNSKPKIFENHTSQPSDMYGKTTSYYATPNRRNSAGNHQVMGRRIVANSDHEYAEPHAQYAQPRCLFSSDETECANLATCALMVPNTRL